MPFVDSPVWELRFKIEDPEGETSSVLLYRLFDAGESMTDVLNDVDTFTTRLTALANGQVRESSLTIRRRNTASPPRVKDGTGYTNIEDKALLTFRTVQDGSSFTLTIPTPKSTVFLADEETVDPNSTPVANLLTDLLSSGVDKHGNAPLYYITGHRIRKPTRRTVRPGIFTETGG